MSEDERESRAFFAEAKRRGFRCSFSVKTFYGYEDALSGELGVLHLGPVNSSAPGAVRPKDAFDASTGCPKCGLGAALVKPLVLSARAIKSKANFHWAEGSGFVLRTEIGREIIEATGRPECMRHPVTKDGKTVEEWLEPVPCAIMPPLSPRSEGVRRGSTTATGGVGDPPKEVPPCPACGRSIWDNDYEHHTRLVYPRAAVKVAQEHGVVAMFEPCATFPTFDSTKRAFKDYYGLPWLLFSRAAVEVLLRYTQREHIRDSAFIQPVFSE